MIEEVLRRLKENNLQVKASKCSWGPRETSYLGYIISKNQKRPDPKKVKALKEMAVPENT